MNKMKKYTVLIIIAIFIFWGLTAFYIWKGNHLKQFVIEKEEWSSEYLSIDDTEGAGFYIKNGMITNSGKGVIDVLYALCPKLSPGSYSVTIEYEANNSHACIVESDEKSFAVKSNNFVLAHTNKKEECNFWLTENVNDLKIVVKYVGKGNLNVNKISVKENRNYIRIIMFLYVLVLISICLYIRLKSIIHNNITTFLGIIIISLLVSVFVFVNGMITGDDYLIHLARIEGVVQALKNGSFPVRMNSILNGGYGYPNSIYYCDLFLYIPAVLRIIGFSIDTSYKIYILLINILTTSTSYMLGSKVTGDNRKALLTALVYTTASYRLVDIYNRAAVGEYTAMAFYPIIALGMWSIYNDNAKVQCTHKRKVMYLIIGMLGILFCHILSIEMGIIVLLCIIAVEWKKTVKQETLMIFSEAAAFAVVIGLWFIVPFIDYYFRVDTSINGPAGVMNYIQEKGLRIGDYFAFFRYDYAKDCVSPTEIMQITPGLCLMIALLSGIILCFLGKADNIIRKLVVGAVITMFVTTQYFPWNTIESLPLGRFFVSIQFPWRYVGVECIILTVLFAYMLKKYSFIDEYYKVIEIITISISCLIVLNMYGQYVDKYDRTTFIDYAELPSGTHYNSDYLDVLGFGEYLPNDTYAEEFTGDVISYKTDVDNITSSGLDMNIHVKTGSEDGYIELPRINYPNYMISDSEGNSYEIYVGHNNTIAVLLGADLDTTLSLQYKEPIYWRLSELVSILGFVAVIIYFRKYRQDDSEILVEEEG